MKIMKKLLLSISAVSLVSLSLFAQTTVVLPWNQYGTATDFQKQSAIALSGTYVAHVGDIITVTMAGTSDFDMDKLQVTVVNLAPPSYWTQLANFDSLTAPKAGVPFNVTVNDTITDAYVLKAGGVFSNFSAAGTFNVTLDGTS